MFVVAAGLFAMFFFNTLYVQRVLGFSPLEAGFAFVPFTAGVIVGAGLSQRLVPALGAREVPLIGLALGAAGLLTFLRLTPDSSYLTGLLPGILLASVGMGLVFVPITLIATSGIPADDADLRPASSTRRSRSAARSASRSSRRSRRAARRTSCRRSVTRRHRPTRRRRSSRASTSRGRSPRASCSWLRRSSPRSCGDATWSPWPRARPHPPSRGRGSPRPPLQCPREAVLDIVHIGERSHRRGRACTALPPRFGR